VATKKLRGSPSKSPSTTKLAAAKLKPELDQEPEKRSIQFPWKSSAGELFLLPEDRESKPKLIGQATGEISVEPSARLFLNFNFDPAEGCSQLRTLPADALFGLSLLGTDVIDSDLQVITHLQTLQELDISCTATTDDCLEHILQLRQLKKLNLASTGVTDAGIGCLVQLPKLTELVLDNTRVTDVGLAAIKELKDLTTLSLSFTSISSRGLASIKELSKLKNLRLNRTGVTNSGVVFLIGLTQLEELWLGGTNVSYRGLNELSTCLPECRVFL